MSPSSTPNSAVAPELEELAVNTIRVLSMEGVEKAKCGHPGLPMGCADIAYTLFSRYLKFNPGAPLWPDRDRFILSAGHGSMLLYSLLHLSGYDLPMKELASFRQWGSMTPGHPEVGEAPGVETTTGPLGQGFVNGVGMALAERLLAERFNTDEHSIVDHYTYALCSDGDLMEGVSQEAASIAAHLGLGKLVYVYDDNDITIEGDTDLTFSEDVGKRFEAYGWQVQKVDGHDREAVARAIEAAREETSRPSLIQAKTVIAKGSPNKAGTHGAHGAALGEDEVAATRKNLGWDHPPFTVPDGVSEIFKAAGDAGAAAQSDWEARFEDYRKKNPEKAALWDRIQSRELPAGIEELLPTWSPEDGGLATRSASGKTINALAEALPELIGGSADLAPSNNTMVSGAESVSATNFAGRNIHFGIREHAMGGIMNGMSLHGGIRPYGGTFLIFSDYMRPTIRLAALMKQPVIYVFTHDSIFLGEDGPTHQPIEQIASLRAIPNLRVMRPADANETAAAWMLALRNTDGPTALALTRQGLPTLGNLGLGKGSERGAYTVYDGGSGDPDILLLSSGSELAPTIEAAKLLGEQGVKARVVNCFCFELFDEQPEDYRHSVLPHSVTKRMAIEAGTPFGWGRYVGLEGKVHGINRFGASAPFKALAEEFGFTGESLAKEAAAYLKA